MGSVINKVASAVLPGPVGSILGGVVGSLTKLPEAVLGGGPGKLFDFAQGLLGLGKQTLGSALRPPSGLPSPFLLPAHILQNATGALQNMTGGLATMNQGFGKILDIMIKQFGGPQGGQQTGGIQPFFPGQNGGVDPAFRYDRGMVSDARQDGKISQPGGLDAAIERVGNKAQGLMDQAQKLAESDNPADQMKAQRMMQQAQRMIEFMSNMTKIIGDMQKNAIQNMR